MPPVVDVVVGWVVLLVAVGGAVPPLVVVGVDVVVVAAGGGAACVVAVAGGGGGAAAVVVVAGTGSSGATTPPAELLPGCWAGSVEVSEPCCGEPAPAVAAPAAAWLGSAAAAAPPFAGGCLAESGVGCFGVFVAVRSAAAEAFAVTAGARWRVVAVATWWTTVGAFVCGSEATTTGAADGGGAWYDVEAAARAARCG